MASPTYTVASNMLVWSGTLSSNVTIPSGQAITYVISNGVGTLKLEASSSFTGTIDGLATGDIIDLTNTVVTNAYFDGSTLFVNGQPVSFHVAGVPVGDTVAFKSDGSGGSILKFLPQVLSVASPPVTGVETTAIPLNFTETIAGSANLAKFVISGIPQGAVVTDGTSGHTYSSGSANGSVDVAGWQLSSLTIKPVNDANFTLSALVTAVDADGYDYTLPTTEIMTVNPTAPVPSWAALSMQIPA